MRVSFEHHPHPHVAARHATVPSGGDKRITLNGRVALLLTTAVGTMWCAYIFALIALLAVPQALSGGLLTFVQWVSQTFIQLVMLSVIMVGQNILGRASDRRAEMTYKDAEATFHEAEQIQAHLKVQDEAMTVILSRLEALDTWAARSADSRRVGLNHPHTVSATHGSGPLTGVSAPGNAPPPRRPVSAARHPISP
jgi:hypothetical protein